MGLKSASILFASSIIILVPNAYAQQDFNVGNGGAPQNYGSQTFPSGESHTRKSKGKKSSSDGHAQTPEQSQEVSTHSRAKKGTSFYEVPAEYESQGLTGPNSKQRGVASEIDSNAKGESRPSRSGKHSGVR